MLSELHELSRALKRSNITPVDIPNCLKQVCGTGFVLLLDPNLNVVGVECYSYKQFKKTKKESASPPQSSKDRWKISSSASESFPEFKLPVPLLKKPNPDDDSARILFGSWHKIGQEHIKALDYAAKNWEPNLLGKSDLNRLRRYLHSIPKKTLKDYRVPSLGAPQNFLDLLGWLDNNIKGSKQEIESFLTNMVRKIVVALANEVSRGNLNEAEQKMVFDGLVLSNPPDDKGNVKRKKQGFVLDNLQQTLFSQQTYQLISQMLLNEERVVTPHANKAIVTCSLCGSPMPEPDKAIPTIRFPVLGETHIFAVNSADVSCTDRFEASRGITPRGKKNSKKWVGARLFPFCSRCQKDVSNATQYIIDKQRNGKTWSKIPGKNGSDLFISYCSDNPALSLDVPLLVSGDTSQLFEVVSQKAQDAFQTLQIPTYLNWEIRCLVLSKVDPGRQQMIYCENFSVSKLMDCVRKWQEASNGLPSRLLGDEYSKILFPMKIIELLKHQWVRSASSYSDRCNSVTVPASLVLSVFFNKADCQSSAATILNWALRRLTPLIFETTARFNRGENIFATKYDVLRAVGLLGIMLNKTGTTKESLMESVEFNLGKLAKLMDVLHRQYSLIVSKRLPGQLIGGESMRRMSGNPEVELARLYQRSSPYLNWLKTKYHQGKWLEIELAETADKLRSGLYGHSMNDAGKAMLLIGYLASLDSEPMVKTEDNQQQEKE